jgi:hypothetical protein
MPENGHSPEGDIFGASETIESKIVEKTSRNSRPFRPKLAFLLGNSAHDHGALLARFLVLPQKEVPSFAMVTAHLQQRSHT